MNALGLFNKVCGESWWHDVRTKRCGNRPLESVLRTWRTHEQCKASLCRCIVMPAAGSLITQHSAWEVLTRKYVVQDAWSLCFLVAYFPPCGPVWVRVWNWTQWLAARGTRLLHGRVRWLDACYRLYSGRGESARSTPVILDRRRDERCGRGSR